MRKRAILIALFLAFAMTSTVALAWCPVPRHSDVAAEACFNGSHPNRTAEQFDEAEALKDSFLKEVVPLQKELLSRAQELRRLWSDPVADPALVKTRQNEMFDLRSEFQDKLSRLRLEIERGLTPGQVALLQASRADVDFGPETEAGALLGFAEFCLR